MNRVRVYFEESPSQTPLDPLINGMLIGIIAFAPLALGSIDPLFEMITQGAVFLTAVLFGAKLALFPESRFVRSWAYVPMIGFILLVVLQLLPIPAEILSVLSPNTVKLKRELLSDLSNVAEITSKLRLTFYAEPTLRQLRLVLMVSAMFVMVLNQFRTLSQIRLILSAMVAVAAFSSLLSITQILTGTDSIYWTVYAGGGIANSGTFANHSHFGQFTNLCIGATLALLFLLLHDQLGSHYRIADILERLRGAQGRTYWLLMGVIVLCAVAIAMSLTRGGTIAMLVAAVVSIALLSRQNREAGIGWISAAVSVAVLAILLYIGFDQISHRFSRLQRDEPVAFRWEMLQSCIDCWKDFPLTGIGLGAFRYVYPSYERVITYGYATHAENEYGQLLMETGIIGFAMIASFIALVFIAVFKAMRNRGSPFAAVGIGLSFGWIAILIQSASDFGEHMPGVAIITATITALIFSVSRAAAYDPAKDEDVSGNIVLRGLSTIAVMGIGAISLMSAFSVQRADAKWIDVLNVESSLWKAQWDVEPKRIFAFLKDAESVVAMRPSNVVYTYLLNQFRLKVGTLARDPKTNAVIVTDDLIQSFRQIAQEINQARALCPTYGPLVAAEGWTRLFLLKDPSGAALIDRAAALAPNDVPTLRMAAELDASRGDWDRAKERFARYVAIYPQAAGDVVNIVLKQYRKPDVAIELTADTPAAAYLLAELENENADAAVLEKLRRYVIAQLLDQSKKQTPSASTFEELARNYAKLNDVTQADEFYQRAVNTAGIDQAMRLRYAEFLSGIDRKEDALKQVDQVLNVDPLNDAAVKLWRKIRGTDWDKR